MNGAESLVRTLVASGVNTCFSNPGTSEMHFVAATDQVEDMRTILCLFEGVATGAADGYGRMMGSPAATLLHLGPGLANGLANLHNARRASTSIVNVNSCMALCQGDLPNITGMTNCDWNKWDLEWDFSEQGPYDPATHMSRKAKFLI